MRKLVSSTFILLMIACVLSAQPVSSEKSLILFDEDVRHIDLAETTRATIQRNGGRVRAVIGVSGILADLTPAALHEIAAISGIRVYRGNDAADAARESDAETSLALTTWNRLREPASNTETGQRLSNDVQANPRRVAGRFQLNTLSAGYQQHWEQTRRTLPPRLQRSSGIGCGSNGADYLDTSLYLAGDVAVGVFYVPSANPWTPALTASTFADVVTALDEFIDIEPRARLTFTYVNEVNGTGNPLAKPPNEYDYVNDLRSTYCTDWAFLIDMSNGGPWPNADYWGPALRMDRTFGWFHDVLRHETAHVFGAWDGYAPNGAPNGRFGYLNGTQGNACGQGGGYFSGAGDCLADLMNGWDPVYGYNSRISVSTAGQLGWSSEGDGLLYVLDTRPVIDAATMVHVVNAATGAVTYHGIAFDRPPLNELQSWSNVSINRITAVQYRLNNGPWQDAAPADGVFDSNSEEFNFTTPALPNGTYTVGIQAVNTIGAVTPVAHVEQLAISGSSITNTRPFASWAITPQRAMSGSTIIANGGASRDLEAGALEYSWNWGSTWTPFSTSPASTHSFTTPGTYPVQLRVRDQGGLIHLVAKTVTITAANTAPVAKFRIAPGNQHSMNQNYSVFLTAIGSSDVETPFNQLKVQWDVDCDGWDAPPALAKTKVVALSNANYPRSDRRCLKMRVIDTANNTAEAQQFFSGVPYNHPPAINNVSFAPSGTDYMMTVSGSDPDSATTWDGIIEYRFDFDGDGIWDTTFGPSSAVLVPSAYRYTVMVEIRDRFNARALWNPCAPLFC